MQKLASGILCFVLFCVHPQSPWAAQPDLASADGSVKSASPALVSADWSVNATHNLASNPPKLDAVKDFENRFWGASEEDAKEFGDDVCEFRFADLRSSGNLSLIVSVGSRNSRFGCTQLYIFDRAPTGFELYHTTTVLLDTILPTACWISIMTAGTSWFSGPIWHRSPQGPASTRSDAARNGLLFSSGRATVIRR